MIAERADYEQLRKWHAKTKDELKMKTDELLASASRVVSLEAQLEIESQKCQVLAEDLKNCDSHKQVDELVKMAWRVRDEAMERKNQVQISLAKSRIEVMQISSQLMEAVQQKAELSQKLAQFEVSLGNKKLSSGDKILRSQGVVQSKSGRLIGGKST